MAVPTVQDLLLPVLRAVAHGKEHMADCLPLLAQEFRLTPDEVEAPLPSGRETVLSNRAHWARNTLFHAGLVEPHSRGRYHVTNDGRALLQSNPTAITLESLRRFPAYLQRLDYVRQRDAARSQGSNPLAGSSPATDEAEQETPEDAMARAHARAEAALVDDLLAAVLSMTPARFEQLIVDLLVAMGYGGGDPAMGERLGRSGDGGIDGIINEDALGLDAVYVQAKRYAPDNRIGRPALQAFVGSLTGEGATKGVFVTTSDFSREARDYLNRVQQRIVLINGDRLARLLIQHEVGVRARRTYVLRSVDEDYFADA